MVARTGGPLAHEADVAQVVVVEFGKVLRLSLIHISEPTRPY